MKITLTVLVVLAVAAGVDAASTVAATTAAGAATTAAAAATTAAAGAATTAAAGAATTAAAGAATTAAAGTGANNAATTAGAGATTAQTPVSCLSCNETHAGCENATDAYNNTITCTGGCWVYREETSSNAVTYSRGCGRSDTSDTACQTEHQSERCMTVSGVNVCRRCCTAANCNHAALMLTGKATAAHVSFGVLMASLVMVVFARESA
ncbi:spore coat protein SP65-like [Branchiostoma floridae]|uniref:Spore coat protein SP65-like n=1 Tax=Branchiostoma floridae TaxID=7739 RepID=A0A9J7MBL0_BRAFL|nr:spore coat protein SP65-like [Branchiostoma floridae]